MTKNQIFFTSLTLQFHQNRELPFLLHNYKLIQSGTTHSSPCHETHKEVPEYILKAFFEKNLSYLDLSQKIALRDPFGVRSAGTVLFAPTWSLVYRDNQFIILV